MCTAACTVACITACTTVCTAAFNFHKAKIHSDVHMSVHTVVHADIHAPVHTAVHAPVHTGVQACMYTRADTRKRVYCCVLLSIGESTSCLWNVQIIFQFWAVWADLRFGFVHSTDIEQNKNMFCVWGIIMYQICAAEQN